MRPDVTVTPTAETFMRRMVRFSNHPSGGFRLRVSPGGCSGLASNFSVEAEPNAGDAELRVNGLRIFLPAETWDLLDGATVDFADSAMQSGLVVQPKAGVACGCSSAGTMAPPSTVAVPIALLRRR